MPSHRGFLFGGIDDGHFGVNIGSCGMFCRYGTGYGVVGEREKFKFRGPSIGSGNGESSHKDLGRDQRDARNHQISFEPLLWHGDPARRFVYPIDYRAKRHNERDPAQRNLDGPQGDFAHPTVGYLLRQERVERFLLPRDLKLPTERDPVFAAPAATSIALFVRISYADV